MPVGCEDHMPLLIQDAVVGKDREIKDHLVDVRIAVAAHAENVFFHSVEKVDDFFGSISFREVVAGTVIEDIPQKQQFIRLFFLVLFQQLSKIESASVDVGCNHYFHGVLKLLSGFAWIFAAETTVNKKTLTMTLPQ